MERRRPHPTSYNGILAYIGGEHVARAIAQCPDANAAAVIDEFVATIEVPELGAVAIRCERARDPRWRRRFWSAVWAEQAD